MYVNDENYEAKVIVDVEFKDNDSFFLHDEDGFIYFDCYFNGGNDCVQPIDHNNVNDVINEAAAVIHRGIDYD